MPVGLSADPQNSRGEGGSCDPAGTHTSPPSSSQQMFAQWVDELIYSASDLEFQVSLVNF